MELLDQIKQKPYKQFVKDHNEKLLHLLCEHSEIDFKNQKELLASEYFSELTMHNGIIYHKEIAILQLFPVETNTEYREDGSVHLTIFQKFRKFF